MLLRLRLFPLLARSKGRFFSAYEMKKLDLSLKNALGSESPSLQNPYWWLELSDSVLKNLKKEVNSEKPFLSYEEGEAGMKAEYLLHILSSMKKLQVQDSNLFSSARIWLEEEACGLPLPVLLQALSLFPSNEKVEEEVMRRVERGASVEEVEAVWRTCALLSEENQKVWSWISVSKLNICTLRLLSSEDVKEDKKRDSKSSNFLVLISKVSSSRKKVLKPELKPGLEEGDVTRAEMELTLDKALALKALSLSQSLPVDIQAPLLIKELPFPPYQEILKEEFTLKIDEKHVISENVDVTKIFRVFNDPSKNLLIALAKWAKSSRFLDSDFLVSLFDFSRKWGEEDSEDLQEASKRFFCFGGGRRREGLQDWRQQLEGPRRRRGRGEEKMLLYVD